MAVIKGEYTFRVRFIQLRVLVGAYSKAIVLYHCSKEIYLSSPLNKLNWQGRDRRFSVKLIDKKIEIIP